MAEPGASQILNHHATVGRRFSYERAVNELLAGTDIKINGSRPWDIRVHDERFFHRIVGQGTLGAGESYMDGWWDCEQLDEMLTRILRHDIEQHLRSPRGRVAGDHRAPHQHAEPAPRLPGGQATLRPRRRPLRAHARSAHDLYLRLLGKHAFAGCGAGGEARPRRAQARHQARHARARHRLWLGRRRAVHGGVLRSLGNRRHRFAKSTAHGAKTLRGLAGRHHVAGLPQHEWELRRHLLAGHVRARRRSQLPHVPEEGA